MKDSGQIFKARKATETEVTNLKDKLEKVEEVKTREVRLLYSSCCGCGCHDVNVRRNVPIDSPLKNGDRISKIEKGDNY